MKKLLVIALIGSCIFATTGCFGFGHKPASSQNENVQTPPTNTTTKHEDTDKNEDDTEKKENSSKLIKVSYYDGDGNLNEYYEYKYDNTEEWTQELYYRDGVLGFRKERKYDAKGNYINEKQYIDEELIYDIELTYDEAGNCIREYGTDDGYLYEVKREYNNYNHLVKEVEYGDDGDIDGYYYRECLYDSKGNLKKYINYDIDNNVCGYAIINYNSNNDVSEIVTYTPSDKIEDKVECFYNSDGKLMKETYSDLEYGTYTETFYNENNLVYKTVTYDKYDNVKSNNCRSFVYDSKGNIRIETVYSDKKCENQVMYNYSNTCDIKAKLMDSYWYHYEPTIGGYTRYKFFEDGTYESFWIVDYAPDNQIYTGNYRIEGDNIIIEGISEFSTYYNEEHNIFGYESFIPEDINPMYYGSYIDVLVPSEKYYEVHGEEMMQELGTIVQEKYKIFN